MACSFWSGFFLVVGELTSTRTHSHTQNTLTDEARAKWEAWEGRKGLSADEAKKLYVEEWEKQKTEYMPKE